MGTLIDLKGKIFGRLKVTGKGHVDKHGCVHWICICECGKNSVVAGQSLRTGKTNSCGCLAIEQSKSKEARERMSIRNKGKALTEEHKKKISNALKGENAPWYGKKIPREHVEKSKASMRKKYEEGFIHPKRGKKFPQYQGENSPSWKGDKCTTPKMLRIRNSTKYKEWRKAVFERDDYTCQECGKRGGKLNADHIKEFCSYPKLRLELSNGRTLCEPCHKLTPNYGGKARKNVK